MNSIVKKNTGSDMKADLLTLHEMINDAEECISNLQNAFIYDAPQFLKECTSKAETIKRDAPKISEHIRTQIERHPDLQPYVSIPDHILKIGTNIEKLSESVNKKIMGNILFSDRAVKESTFLLQRLTEVLAPTSDIILARNRFLGMYIQETQAEVEKKALEYATLHEERLIKGICNDAASIIFIAMLDAIKSIAWHSKEISVKLAGK